MFGVAAVFSWPESPVCAIRFSTAASGGGSGVTPESPVLWTGVFFWETYKRPLHPQRAQVFYSSFFSLSPTIVDLGKLAPLPIPPMILAYL